MDDRLGRANDSGNCHSSLNIQVMPHPNGLGSGLSSARPSWITVASSGEPWPRWYTCGVIMTWPYAHHAAPYGWLERNTDRVSMPVRRRAATCCTAVGQVLQVTDSSGSIVVFGERLLTARSRR